MKTRIAALLLALLAPAVYAQQPEMTRWVPLSSNRDYSSTSYTYCSSATGVGSQSPDNPWVKAQGRITSSGSSTTFTSLVASSGAFSVIKNGTAGNYMLRFPVSGVRTYAMVTAAASADSITVTPAADLTTAGVYYEYALVNQCGTGATSGWFNTSGYSEVDVTVAIRTLASTSATYDIQCRDEGPFSNPIDVSVSSAITAAATYRIVIVQPYAQCRVGIKVAGDAGGDAFDTGVTLVQNR